MTVIEYAHIDHTRGPFHRWQWTFTQTRTGILVQLLGILITVALNQLWTLVQSVWLVQDRAQNRTTTAPGTALALSRTPKSLWELIIDLLNQAHEELFPPVQLPGAAPKAHWSRILLKTWLVVVAFAIFVGILALGVLANTLQGNSDVLMTSEKCGLYVPLDTSWQKPVYPPDELYENKATYDAQQYARLCYNGRKLDYGCDQFANQAISYRTTVNDECPFRGGLCHLGPKGAITFNTDPTPASRLGINAKPSLQFDRSTTCAPVTMNDTFIKYNQINDEKDCVVGEHTYHYGWSTYYPDASYRSPAYGSGFWKEYLGAYFMARNYQYGSPLTKWNPMAAIPEMEPLPGEILTMLFIKPGRVTYLARSDDPIFPANSPVKVDIGSGGQTFDAWEYNGGHARVLACVDRLRWRELADGPGWHEQHEMPKSLVGTQWILWRALQPIDIFHSVDQFPLNASSLISDWVSLPVDAKQWEVEARQMFETSLARAQFEVKYSMLGVYADFPGWAKISTGTTTGDVCHHSFISKDPDFANINGIAYLMILIPCLAVILLSCPCGDSLLWEWLLGRKYAERVANAIVSASRSCGIAAYLIVRISLDSLLWSLRQLWSMSCQTFRSVWNWTRMRRLAMYNGPPRGTAITAWALDLLRARR